MEFVGSLFDAMDMSGNFTVQKKELAFFWGLCYNYYACSCSVCYCGSVGRAAHS